jgi:hypothetical protein
MTSSTARCVLTDHGRPARSAVSFRFGGFIDGIKEIEGIDELGLGIGKTTLEFIVVHAASACRNEEVGDGDAESDGDSFDGLDSDVASGAFDA